MHLTPKIFLVTLSLLTFHVSCGCACAEGLPLFEGFGVFIGSIPHFKDSPPGTIKKVVERVYTDLGIRLFRTSYEPEFSLKNHSYSISCSTSINSCFYIKALNAVRDYSDSKVFASIWSPPHYMKHPVFHSLLEDYEMDYFYFITNITEIIKKQFRGLEIERVSPVNEPENVFASWDHTNMSPHQLCRMVQKMNSSLVSLCPENSYFWMTQLYTNYRDKESGVDCSKACEIYATHAYTLDIDFWSPFRLLAYYDPAKYLRQTPKPIWQTEVSSTYPLLPTIPNQMKEALDLVSNIVNFVGTTCVQRYYFWQMYTRGASGESLIWGRFNNHKNSQEILYNSKKYFGYRHFTLGSKGGPKRVLECEIIQEWETISCLKFVNPGDNATSVIFVNKGSDHFRLEGVECLGSLCCTTQEMDWNCVIGKEILLPKKGICSCKIRFNLGESYVATKNVFNNEVND